MIRKAFLILSGLALRALAVIIVMLMTTATTWADDEFRKDVEYVGVAPLTFKSGGAAMDETTSQQLWNKLMKYKFWGTGEVVFNKDGLMIKEPSGYTGTAGQKISLDATHTTSGAIVFNGSHTLGGPICEDDKDLSVPALDVSGISWEPAVNLISENAGEIQFIFVPPINEEDMLNKHIWYDKYLEGITFGNNSGKTLYIMMPSARLNANRRKGRFTRIFLRDGITIQTSANDCKIRVVYVNDDATWNSTTKKWEGFDLSKSTIIDGEHYLGDLLFYTNADITWGSKNSNMKADLLGTFITSGSLTVNNHINITGQLIAGKSLLFADEFDGQFQYVSFNPVSLRGDRIPNIKINDDGDGEFDLYLDDDALTEVSFDYSFDFISSDDPKFAGLNKPTRDDMGANPTDETDPHYMPFAQDGKTKHVVIPQGKHHLDKTIYLNVKPDIFEIDAFMLLRISNLHGAVMLGNIKDGAFLLKVTPPNKPPYFVDMDKIKLAVRENTLNEKAGQIKAEDEEGDSYMFEITGGTAEDLFEIGLSTGNVTLKHGVEPFDYEEWKDKGTEYTIVVDLCDTRAMSYNTDLCTQAKFTVSVIDQNEKPEFTNQSDVILFADGAAVSTDAITYADPDKYTTEFLNNELVIMGDESNLFEITADGYIKPKDGAVIDKSEYEIEVRVRDANKDKEGNLIYPDLYEDKTFTLRYYTTNVDYLDWDDTAKKLVKKNTATDDNDANNKVWILDGTESTLPSGWYIARGNVSYSDELTFEGDTHLILADNCKMTVGTEQNPINGSSIFINDGKFTISGQSTGDDMGSLTAVGKNNGIFDQAGGNDINTTINGNITINGGLVTAIGGGYGILVRAYKDYGSITINGGIVNATSQGSNDGIFAYSYTKSNITINGGQVTASGGGYGIKAYTEAGSPSVSLGWTEMSDFILASGYPSYTSDGSIIKIEIPKGKGFLIDGTTTAFGSATADFGLNEKERYDIADKKLIPALPIATGDYAFVAFTDDLGCWKPLSDDVQVYVVTGYDLAKGKVYLKAVEGNVIPKGMPVVIGNKTEGAALPTDFFLVGSDTQTTIEGELKNFVSCDGSKTVQDHLNALFGEGASASEYIAYVITGGTFTSVEVKASDVIKKNVCLLFIPKWDVLMGKSAGTTNASTRSIGIGDGETTSLREVKSEEVKSEKFDADAWYLLDGRKISKPTKKGIYIYKGQKVKI